MVTDDIVESGDEQVPVENQIQEVLGHLFPPAGIFRRVAALAIDLSILGIMSVLIAGLFGNSLFVLGTYARLITFIPALVYLSCFASILGRGKSLGKRVMHLSVVNLEGGLISLPRALLRSSVLLIFFLFLGWNPPIFFGNEWIKTLAGLIVFGMGGAFLYLLIFNRKNGRNLHDLVARTRVVDDRGDLIEDYPATQRKHVFGAVVTGMVLFFVLMVLPQTLLNKTVASVPQENMVQLYEVLEKDPRFVLTGVSDRQVQSGNQQPARILIVSLWPQAYLEDEDRRAIVQEVTAKVPNYLPVEDYDALVIQVTNMYDLGFFERSLTWSYQPPEDWNQLKESQKWVIFYLTKDFTQ